MSREEFKKATADAALDCMNAKAALAKRIKADGGIPTIAMFFISQDSRDPDNLSFGFVSENFGNPAGLSAFFEIAFISMFEQCSTNWAGVNFEAEERFLIEKNVNINNPVQWYIFKALKEKYEQTKKTI